MLVQFFAGPFLDVGFQRGVLHFTVEYFQQLDGPFFDVAYTQQFHAFLCLDGQIGTDEIDEEDGVADVFEGKVGFFPEVAVQFRQAERQVAAGVNQCAEFLVGCVEFRLAYLFDFGQIYRFPLHQVYDAETAEALEQSRDALVWQFQDAHDFGHGAHAEQSVDVRFVFRGVGLAHHADEAVVFLGLFDDIE